MARFDVHSLPKGAGFLLNCQSDIFRQFDTRFVVPLLPPDLAPPVMDRLNPSFTVHDRAVVMVTQNAAAVPTRLLREPITSLADHYDVIMGALDMLLTGY